MAEVELIGQPCMNKASTKRLYHHLNSHTAMLLAMTPMSVQKPMPALVNFMEAIEIEEDRSH